jgi:hypothetical protein
LGNLEELKSIAEEHMKNQIKIVKMLTTLNMNEIIEFNKWYKTHPYYEESPKLIKSFKEMKDQIY